MIDQILCGDALTVLAGFPEACVDMCVTSPPYYGLRDYGVNGQIGLEASPEEYVAKLVAVFHEVKRVLEDDGTLWLNLGDSYAGSGKGLYGDGNSYGTEGDKQKTNVGSIGVRMGTKEGDPGHTHGIKPPNGYKAKDLLGIPWLVAFALRADGWYLRSDIIWHKPNPMPESVTDRPTKSHEYIFLLSKSSTYYYDADAIAEQGVGTEYDKTQRPLNRMANARYLKEGKGQMSVGASLGNGSETRNKRDVWTITTKSYKGAHFATFPPDLIEPCILAGSKASGLVLDPFMGSGTVAQVAIDKGRHYLGIELSLDYCELARKRILSTNVPLFI